MSIVTRGFRGRRDPSGVDLPPGQYLTHDFPVLQVGPTPPVDTDSWRLTVRNEVGQAKSWSWQEFLELPTETPTVDIHCVTRWSKLATAWEGVSLDTLLEDVDTAADHVHLHSHDGYTTNLPLEDLLDGRAWIAHRYEGEDLAPEHGGPARLLVPHLYFWKSAKWIKSIELTVEDEPGFWEVNGYHMYGDPWREQRYTDDQ